MQSCASAYGPDTLPALGNLASLSGPKDRLLHPPPDRDPGNFYEPALADCPGPCACYAEGYVQGKEKAHFEIRAVLDSNHVASCGCEPCSTAREVVARRLLANNSSVPFE